jgi:hypothetical protein
MKEPTNKAALRPWVWFVLAGMLLISLPVIAARLATVIQTSNYRQVTDPWVPLPPEEDGSIVVSLTGDRPISLATPNMDFDRVDEYTFTTRFPWNWTSARTVVFVDDLDEETTVEVVPGLATAFTPLDHQIPVLHITCDSTALWDPEVGIYTTGNYENFLQQGSDWEHPARFEYYLPGSGKVVDEPIGLRIHGGYGRYYHQKGLRFYFDDYGSSNFLNFPFFEYGPTEFDRLIIRASRFDDVCINTNLVETLFADLGHLASRYRFVAVYLNREYWGAYSLRERLDDEFFRHTWDLGYGGLNLIKDGETQYGDGNSWWDFLESFGQVGNPEDEQWFETVRQNLDLASYIDWQIINMFCVSGDNGFAWNLVLFQTGEHPWRLVMWDEDLLLGSADLNTNMFRFLTSRDESEWNAYRAPSDQRPWNASDQQWLTMFRKLLGNSQFRSLFRSRLEHLLDGAMTTENLVARVNEMAVGQLPEIPAHAHRWAGFESHWYNSNVDRTNEWLTDRRPVFLAQADSFFNEFSLPQWSGDYTGLVINEFLASNNFYGQDESGDYADWIEIYNGGPATINLTGMHLTDDLTLTTKWEFPAVLLPAGQRLIVWCDEDPGQGPLHANFKLRASGEEIGLYAPLAFGNGAIDTYVFGPQTPDVSEGRSGDGSQQWVFLDPPTFNGANGDTAGVPPYVPLNVVFNQNYPNPFNPGTTMMFGVPQGGHVRISVYDVRGQLVSVLVDETMNAGMHQIEWLGVDDSGRQVSSGLYIARMQFGSVQKTRNMTLIR